MKKNTLRVDIVSDVVCPWCVIGLKNLQKSKIALSKEIKFDIGWKPYELRPQIPSEGIPRKKYPNDLNTSIQILGKELGFNFNFHKIEIVPNTFHAHRLIWYVKKKDIQNEISEKLFEAYFTNGINIGLKENLIEVSSALGIPKKEISSFLNSDKGVEEIRLEKNKIRDMNISGVPTFILNKKYLLQGGQDSTTMVAFFRRILEKDNLKS